MYDIREEFLPAFIAGYGLVALIHMVGLVLILKGKFHPANQRLMIINLALTEFCFNVHQVIVYTFLMAGLCDVICEWVDYFLYLLFAGANKLIMIYLICDRLLDVQLHLRYPIYFTEKRVKKILLALWIFCGIYAPALIIFDYFKIGNSLFRKTIEMFFFIGSDIIIVVSALVTYSFLYAKVRRFRAFDKSQRKAGRNSNIRSSNKSKFFLPCLIIATYLIFNTSADVMLNYKIFFMKVPVKSYTKSIVSEIAHWLWILGWLSDGVLYIFLQKAIKKRLRSIFKKKRSLSSYSLEVVTKGTSRSSTAHSVFESTHVA